MDVQLRVHVSDMCAVNFTISGQLVPNALSQLVPYQSTWTCFVNSYLILVNSYPGNKLEGDWGEIVALGAEISS